MPSYPCAATVAHGKKTVPPQLREMSSCAQLSTPVGLSGRSAGAYHVRSRVKAQMNRQKLFGERIISRDPDRQIAEIEIRMP